MGHTIAEKIIAAHAGKKEVFPGDMVMAKVDLVLANDITAPLAIKVLEEHGIDKVFDPEKNRLGNGPLHPRKGYKGCYSG